MEGEYQRNAKQLAWPASRTRVTPVTAGPCSNSRHPKRLTAAEDRQHRESARNKKREKGMNREGYETQGWQGEYTERTKLATSCIAERGIFRE